MVCEWWRWSFMRLVVAEVTAGFPFAGALRCRSVFAEAGYLFLWGFKQGPHSRRVSCFARVVPAAVAVLECLHCRFLQQCSVFVTVRAFLAALRLLDQSRLQQRQRFLQVTQDCRAEPTTERRELFSIGNGLSHESVNFVGHMFFVSRGWTDLNCERLCDRVKK